MPVAVLRDDTRLIACFHRQCLIVHGKAQAATGYVADFFGENTGQGRTARIREAIMLYLGYHAPAYFFPIDNIGF